MIPKKYAHLVFGLILSGLMSMLVSGIATVRVTGVVHTFPMAWFESWVTSWAVAFPSVLVVAPIARKLVGRLTADE